MSDDKEFDRWHAGLNKIVSVNTGEAVNMSDPLDTPIVVLSAGEDFKSKSEPLVIEDAITGRKVDLSEPDPVTIIDNISGYSLEV